MARTEGFGELRWEEVGDLRGEDGEGACPADFRERADAICDESAAPLPGPPVPPGLGRPHPDRARQFSPFAALRGYYELVHEKEVVPEERRPLAEEEARAIQETLESLPRGAQVRCTFYENAGYRTVCGTVSQVDMIYHDLWIVRRRIPFREICALEAL